MVTNHFTRYAKAYVTTNQMAHTVAHVFINEYVVNYGWPEKILTDQAKDFEGKVFKELCDQALGKKLRMTPYHPQGNGQPEWFNRTLLTMLGTLPLDSKKRWEDWVSNLMQAYNSSPSSHWFQSLLFNVWEGNSHTSGSDIRRYVSRDKSTNCQEIQ